MHPDHERVFWEGIQRLRAREAPKPDPIATVAERVKIRAIAPPKNESDTINWYSVETKNPSE